MIGESREKREKTTGIQKYNIVEYMDNDMLKLEKDGQIFYALRGEGVIANGMFFARKDSIFNIPDKVEKQKTGKAGELLTLFREGGEKIYIKGIDGYGGYITTKDGDVYIAQKCLIGDDGKNLVVMEDPGLKDQSGTDRVYQSLANAFRGEANKMAKLKEVHGNVGVFEDEEGRKIAAVLKTGDENAYIDGVGPVRTGDETVTDEIEEAVKRVIPPFFGPIQFTDGLKLGTQSQLVGFKGVDMDENGNMLETQLNGYVLIARIRSFITEEDKVHGMEVKHASLRGVEAYKELDGHFEIVDSEVSFDGKERLIISDNTCIYYEGTPVFEYILVPEIIRIW